MTAIACPSLRIPGHYIFLQLETKLITFQIQSKKIIFPMLKATYTESVPSGLSFPSRSILANVFRMVVTLCVLKS